MHVYISITVKTLGVISFCDGGKLGKNLKGTITFSSFSILESKSALVCDMLSYKSQFVGQLYTCDLIYFTTDLHSVIYYSTNHC